MENLLLRLAKSLGGLDHGVVMNSQLISTLPPAYSDNSS